MKTANRRYAIGLDFGTLTARGVLVDVASGEEIAISICGYQDAVMDQVLPEFNLALPSGYALQNPQDYEYALESILKDVWRKAEIQPEQVIGIGIDFIACSLLPLDRRLKPLCCNPRFRKSPHSWVKIWKHHSAQHEADEISRIALERDESFIHDYGDSVSCQMMLPKILETLNNAPNVYRAAHRFVEAGDWIVYLLTGNLLRSSGMAGFKAFWSEGAGFPSREYFAAVSRELQDVVEKKLGSDVTRSITAAGHLSKRLAEITGLSTDTMVAVCNIDAHSSFLGGGITDSSTMMMAMGMCICHMLVSPIKVHHDMFAGVVKDGILPGFYGYETSQSAVGEMFDWLLSTSTSSEYLEEASKHSVDLYSILNDKIARMQPGESGILALDWWNGNGSFLKNGNLSGLLVGMTLSTTTDDIYRGLVESTAFGARKIVEGFEANGMGVSRIYACGALAFNAPQIMQIYADIIGKPIAIARSRQTAALGAAMSGAVAAGSENGGYDTIFEAIKHMSKPPLISFSPNRAHREVYQQLYDEYNRLHDCFGCGEGNTMETLKRIRKSAKSRRT